MDWLVDALEDAVCLEDAEGRLVDCNRAFEALVGEHKQQLLGQVLASFVEPALLTGEGPERVCTRKPVVAPDGRALTLLLLRDRTEEAQRAHGLSERAKELEASERKLVELLSRQRSVQQAQRLESVGQLTGGIAHDFNNLLAVITGCMELLKVRAGENRPVIELADRALTAAERGAALIQRLLAFSRRQMLSPEATNVNSMISEMLDLSRRSLGENIEIETDLCGDPWPVLVDPSQLENAILNLVINARDSMPDGGILMLSTAKVRLAEPEDGLLPGDYIRVGVADTGTGISREHLARVFEPFFTTKETGRGSGLGLSMVYGFVTQSNGAVRIQSELGAGTTVQLFLPRVGSEPASELRQAGEQPRGRGELVMVVEDDSAVRRTVVSVLEALDYRVIEASSAADAIELLQRGPLVDLLLTDVVLGGTASGPELVDRAREARPELRAVFMTGYADQHLSQVGRDARVLKKPFRAPELARLLREVLDG